MIEQKLLDKTVGGLAAVNMVISDALKMRPGIKYLSLERDMLNDWAEICANAVRFIVENGAQEKEPVEMEMEGGGSSWWYVCKVCHTAVDQGDHYCRQCGQPFKPKQGVNL